MANQIPSRTKRRMEKRQAVWMLTLVLVVSLISFGLGIMVGKRGTPPVVQNEKPQLVTRLPIASEPAAEKEEPPALQPPQEATKPQLTFYETLAETKKQPLGTGINLPPQTEKKIEKLVDPPVEKQSMPHPAALPPMSAAPVPQSVVKVKDATQVEYVVQTGSFKKMEDAERLKSQLLVKGYEVFVQKADLKEKGVWYRVFLGPLATKGEAEALAGNLKQKERLSGFVRRM